MIISARLAADRRAVVTTNYATAEGVGRFGAGRKACGSCSSSLGCVRQ